MDKTIISLDDLRELREQASLMNPAVKVVNLNEIELDANSIATNTIRYQGIPVRVADGFIRNLANILNVNVKLQRNLVGDEEVGQEMFAAMLNGLKMFNSRKRVPQVTLVGDTRNGIFTNVVAGQYARLSNESMFDIAEDLISKNNGLQLIEAKISDTQPDIMLKLLAPNEHKLVKSNDEIFNFGITLSNNAINSYVGDFAYRLVCANGMMGMKMKDQFKLENIDTQGLLNMQHYLGDAAERHFMPADFEENVSTAQNVEASFAEVENAFRFVKGQLNCLDDQKDRIEAAIAFRYFEGYFNTLDKLKRAGVELSTLDRKQKQFIPSGMMMWDLINNITNLGSNKLGYEFRNPDELQVFGGKLMSKDADLKYAKYLHLK